MKKKVFEEMRETKREIRRESKHYLNQLEFLCVFRRRNRLGKLHCQGESPYFSLFSWIMLI